MMSSPGPKTKHSVCFVLCGGDVERDESGYEERSGGNTTDRPRATSMTFAPTRGLISRSVQRRCEAPHERKSLVGYGEYETAASGSFRREGGADDGGTTRRGFSLLVKILSALASPTLSPKLHLLRWRIDPSRLRRVQIWHRSQASPTFRLFLTSNNLFQCK